MSVSVQVCRIRQKLINIKHPARVIMDEYDTVYVRGIGWQGFEKLCERIFKEINAGDVKRIGGVADGGRDLMIDGPDGRTIVECKYYKNSSISRPVVQKLHSAVISNKGKKGIIISTGRYTKQAIEYAASLKDITMELYDMLQLRDLAERAGIKLVTGSNDRITESFQILSLPDTVEKISRRFQYKSHPNTVKEFMQTNIEGTQLMPYYMIRASIRQTFSTSAGIIHEINRSELKYVLNGITGRFLMTDYVKFLRSGKTCSPKNVRVQGDNMRRERFMIGGSLISHYIEKRMIADHTKTVEYVAGNNATYYKECIPSKNAITIEDIKAVLVPMVCLKISFVERGYTCYVTHNGLDVKIDCPELCTCYTCGKKIKVGKKKGSGQGLLCNDCGAVSHAPSFFRPHSHICKKCGKTLCRSCTYVSRRALFLRKKMCKSCAESSERKFKKIASARQIIKNTVVKTPPVDYDVVTYHDDTQSDGKFDVKSKLKYPAYIAKFILVMPFIILVFVAVQQRYKKRVLDKLYDYIKK